MAWTRIRDLREDRDFSQRQLAEFHGVSVDYLLGRTDVPEPYPEK